MAPRCQHQAAADPGPGPGQAQEVSAPGTLCLSQIWAHPCGQGPEGQVQPGLVLNDGSSGTAHSIGQVIKGAHPPRSSPRRFTGGRVHGGPSWAYPVAEAVPPRRCMQTWG